MSAERYYHDPDAAAAQIAERWDSDAQTYTAWAEDGAVIVSKPFTAQEIIDYPPAGPVDNQEPVTVDPDVHADLVTQAAAATTMPKLRAALLALLEAYGPADR